MSSLCRGGLASVLPCVFPVSYSWPSMFAHYKDFSAYKTVALLAQEYSNQRGALGPLGRSKSLDRVEILSSFSQDSNVAHRAMPGPDVCWYSGYHTLLPVFPFGMELVFPGRVLSLTSLGPHGHLGW